MVLCRAVTLPCFHSREPWSSFLPSTTHGALLGRNGHVWLCLNGSSWQWLLLTLVQGGSTCGAERCAGRRALPPLDIRCSTEWHSLPRGTRWTLLMPLLKASPPVATSGGPAVDPAHGAALQLQIRLWSLPPGVVCLSACFRRWARHVTWMVCTFAVVEFYSSVRLPHILWTLLASCVQWTACAHAYSSHCMRASCETASLSDAGQSRSWYQNTCVTHSECAHYA